jgi:hypothetical protein
MADMIFIVLGMHKSGTTLIAQSLHRSGINMGWDITEEHFTYRGNHCESPRVNQINDRLLDSIGKLSYEITSSPPRQTDPATIADLQAFIRKQNALTPRWGIKDPRLCFTYPVWSAHLPPHKLIVIFRSPCEVALHYLERAPRREKLSRYWKALRAWGRYNANILEILHQKDAQELIVFEYGRLMRSDDLFDRFFDFVGMDLVDMRDPDKYHQRLNNKSFHRFLCRQIFNWNLFDIRTIMSQLENLAARQLGRK